LVCSIVSYHLQTYTAHDSQRVFGISFCTGNRRQSESPTFGLLRTRRQLECVHLSRTSFSAQAVLPGDRGQAEVQGGGVLGAGWLQGSTP